MQKSLIVAMALCTHIFGGGEIEPLPTSHHTESDFYMVTKALHIPGKEINHGHAILEGNRGYGFGIDIGYRLGHGFAIEYDFSYAKNTITQHTHEHPAKEGDGTYLTSTIDIVYVYELTHTLGLFAKIGYEYEREEVEALGIDNSDYGTVYGLGAEIAINHDYKFLLEYEHSSIESPRGDSYFMGLMYNFN